MLLVSNGTSSICSAYGIEDYGADKPYIFIGGFPRSGTTLMRVLLDVHPDISCGPETHISPTVAAVGASILRSKSMRYRLEAINLWPDTVFKAFRGFFIEIIEATTDSSKRSCTKDPYMLKSIDFLNRLFPRAKFILMIRDGRAVTASVMKRSVSIQHIDINNPFDIFYKWENSTTVMTSQCELLGPLVCLPVRYEDLVLRPRETMLHLTKFLEITWTDAFLAHDKIINSSTHLSPFELSNSQVIHPINLEAIYSWARPGTVLPQQFILKARSPMLVKYRYFPNSLPPNYGPAEPEMLENLKKIQNDAAAMQEFSPFMKARRNFSRLIEQFDKSKD
ncbi:Tyrosylprotein sulfotransferase [Cichlidogyrus casuarinus]|uniref:Protein-tyrosine sulfotransferase n=1 Tax=Cichlidogyrus casuarinus TaxID=1844966 RepID=A0ABD2PSB4_9PLAT